MNQSNKGLTCTFRASCYSACLSWALVLTWVIPFIQDKKVGVWVGREIGIHTEGALPPSITVMARVLFMKEFWFSNKIQG